MNPLLVVHAMLIDGKSLADESIHFGGAKPYLLRELGALEMGWKSYGANVDGEMSGKRVRRGGLK